MSQILIVDDSQIIHRTLSLIVRKIGHSTLHAASGMEALDLIETQTVDLAIIDMNMPGMNGLVLVENIRTRGHSRQLPIIFLTGSGREKDQQSALELGVDNFLQKPVSSHQLREVINRLLPQS
ncbi:MAG: response regulator [Ardenticatenaceae bacterium]|nr:response regulator [Anaerolineales bacterium]MCB8977248.1 response regulator [Ardenticatenaceae bacterium]